MTDSETRGWKRDDGTYGKTIEGHDYRISKRETGFFPGGWQVRCGNEMVTDKYGEPRRLRDAKKAAHKHARERV